MDPNKICRSQFISEKGNKWCLYATDEFLFVTKYIRFAISALSSMNHEDVFGSSNKTVQAACEQWGKLSKRFPEGRYFPLIAQQTVCSLALCKEFPPRSRFHFAGGGARSRSKKPAEQSVLPNFSSLYTFTHADRSTRWLCLDNGKAFWQPRCMMLRGTFRILDHFSSTYFFFQQKLSSFYKRVGLFCFLDLKLCWNKCWVHEAITDLDPS